MFHWIMLKIERRVTLLGGSSALVKGENVTHCGCAPEIALMVTDSKNTAAFTEELLPF